MPPAHLWWWVNVVNGFGPSGYHKLMFIQTCVAVSRHNELIKALIVKFVAFGRMKVDVYIWQISSHGVCVNENRYMRNYEVSSKAYCKLFIVATDGLSAKTSGGTVTTMWGSFIITRPDRNLKGLTCTKGASGSLFVIPDRASMH